MTQTTQPTPAGPSEDLTTFYFTFGQRHQDFEIGPLRHYWVEIQAPNEGIAREIMALHFGPYWAFSYQEDGFNGRYFLGGCMERYRSDHYQGMHPVWSKFPVRVDEPEHSRRRAIAYVARMQEGSAVVSMPGGAASSLAQKWDSIQNTIG